MAAMASSSLQKPSIAVAICAASLACLALIIAAVAKNTPEDYIELHNAARAVVGAGPVSWDGEAARHAAKRAATACGAGFRSSPRSDAAAVRVVYGENVFRGTGTPGAKAWAAADAMRAWTAPAATEHVQVVWPGSDKVGCAHAVCDGECGIVISCSYKPAVKEELRGSPIPSDCRYNISRCIDCPIC